MRSKKETITAPSLNCRLALIDCIVMKLHRMDVETLRESYKVIAAIMDKEKRKKQTTE